MGAERGVRPKGVNHRDLVSQEEARGGGAARGPRRRGSRAEEPAEQAASAGAEPKPARRRRGTRGGRGPEEEDRDGGRRGDEGGQGAEGRQGGSGDREGEAGQAAQACPGAAAPGPEERLGSRARRRSRRQEGDPRSPSRCSSRRSPSSRTGRSWRSTSDGRPIARSRATSTRASSTTSSPGWRRRSSTSASSATASSTWTRSSCPELEGKRHGKRIQELISRGQEVLVQAVKDPMGTKGARLTTEISLPGRFLVYTPYGDGIGVSRRLEDAERERLKTICKGLELPEGGLIVRTAAEGATEAELVGRPQATWSKLWSTITRPSSAHEGARRSSTRRSSCRSASCAISSSATSSGSSSTTIARTGRSSRT